MERTTAWLGICILLLFPVEILHADLTLVQSVEGGPGKFSTMRVKTKGGKIRTDVSVEVSTIADTDSGSVTTLMRSQKAYMTVTADAAKQLLNLITGHEHGDVPSSPAPKLEPTGKHESVNGTDTEIFTSQMGAVKTTYWIAKNHPSAGPILDLFKRLQKTSMGQLANGMVQQPGDLPGVPLKTQIELAKGQKITSTILSVSEQPISDDEFAVPADYTAVAMPSFRSEEKELQGK